MPVTDTILITDDNPENLKVLSRTVASDGYEVRVALTGEQAMQSIEAAPPDLVLLDVQLPKMDGYEVCRRIRGHRDFQSIPVVFISAAAEPQHKLMAFQAGGDDYMTKPVQTEEVLARVKAHLQASKYRQLLEEKNLALSRKYQSAFEQAAVGIVHVDPDSRRFLDVNQRMCELIGYTKEELLAMMVFDISHPDHVEQGKQIVRELVHRDGGPISAERRYRRKDGSFFWGRLTASLVSFDQAGLESCLVGIIEDISERKAAQDELSRSRERLELLSNYLQNAREEERKAVAREIHDDLGQALTAMKMDLSWMGGRLPDGRDDLVGKHGSMLELLDQTIVTVKRICMDLRPGILDDLGLSAAAEWLAGDFSQRTGISCRLAVDPPEIVLDPDLSTAVFRVFQEALTNVMRHAGAAAVEAELSRSEGRLDLTVRDNGKGMEQHEAESPHAFGIIGMRERVRLAGGSLSIRSEPDRGTVVHAFFPLSE